MGRGGGGGEEEKLEEGEEEDDNPSTGIRAVASRGCPEGLLGREVQGAVWQPQAWGSASLSLLNTWFQIGSNPRHHHQPLPRTLCQALSQAGGSVISLILTVSCTPPHFTDQETKANALPRQRWHSQTDTELGGAPSFPAGFTPAISQVADIK